MLKTGKLAALAFLCALSLNPAFAEDKPVAMVNDVAIPQSSIDWRVKAAVAQGQKDTPELRGALRENFINIELMRQQAVKAGLDKKSDIKQQIDLAKQEILANAFVQNYEEKNPVTDAELKEEYNKLKVKLGDKEYEIRHILVATQEEANDVIAQLGKKAKFEKLAKEKSMDSGSKDNGGSLGWNVPRTYVPPFADAVLELKKGEYTKKPVQTQFGWHIIKVDDIRDLKVPKLEEIKPQLTQRLQQQKIQQLLIKLRGEAKIE